MSNVYMKFVFILAIVGGISACTGNNESSDLSGKLTLDNSKKVAQESVLAIFESIAGHDLAEVYFGYYPFSLIRLSICMEGNVQQTDTYDQENQIAGETFAYNDCLLQYGIYNNQSDYVNGSLGFYRSYQNDFHAVSYDNFVVGQKEASAAISVTGKVSVKGLDNSNYENVVNLSHFEKSTGDIIREINAVLNYASREIDSIKWAGKIYVKGEGWFSLIRSQTSDIENYITDGKSSLYIDFAAATFNSVNASVDIGNDGAIDSVWSINLNDR